MEGLKRQMNSDFFSGNNIAGAGSVGGNSSGSMGPVVDSNILNLDRQVFEMKKKQEQVHEQVNSLMAQFNEAQKNNLLKFDRLTGALVKIEQGHNTLVLEAGQKITQMNQKLVDRKSLDQKIQEMMDRHNNVIKGFEVRLNHLQKLLADKEAQLQATQNLLNETKMEIARLRRTY
ncbi:MAG TPA: hypothetical protein PLJ21_00505 [Pseudobdellovibrionaceae bacterium]|nr:hypothetical protein [Pseudobdellovibrionaceae bacterium]